MTLSSKFLLYFCAFYSSYLTLDIVNKYPLNCVRRDRNCIIWTENQSFNTCYIYNNSECRIFLNLTSAKPTILTTENDSPFILDVNSYILNDSTSVAKSPCYNITVTSYSSDITGFMWNLSEIDGSYSSCRVFDFQNSLPIKPPFYFYYECYKDLNLMGHYSYSLKVTSLPNNKEFMYQINVPNVNKNINSLDILQNTINPCKIDTTIMINLGSLNENIVEIKFQKAAEFWNISQYEICLIQKSENQETVIEKEVLLAENSKSKSKQMIFKRFHEVTKGSYYVKLMPISPDKSQECNPSSSEIFLVHKSIKRSSFPLTWIIGIIIVFVIIAGVCISFFIYKRKRKAEFSRRTILLLYCSISKIHQKVIARLTRYLEKFGINVLVNIGLLCEPKVWILGNLSNVDCIVIVLSNDMVSCLNKNILQIEDLEENFYDDIVAIIPELGHKKCVKIYFDNFNTHLIPKEMKSNAFGPEYHLMKDFKKFLCYLNDVNPLCRAIVSLPESEEREKLLFAIAELICDTSQKII